ncbi:PKD domain-containing protein [Cellulomonas sp. URHE0023]|uniref:PKD domain-containing protein n=1 Tax=Cellulomonas sp. URHE0023 TaxID=1380354 RepID=UPI0004844FFD|nr:PKD domain-containing protein [Cellulomonas sp. URHE0023]
MPRTFRRSLTSTLVSAVAVGTVVLAPLCATAATQPPVVYHDEWPQVAADAFTRTSTAGWGTADAGGTWTHAGALTNYQVNGSAGTITVAKAGSTLKSYLDGVASTDTDVTVSVSADKLQTGSGSYLSVVGRRVGTVDVGTKVRLTADSTASVSLLDGAQSIGLVKVPGTIGVGTKLMVRTQVTGTAPTTLRTKAWIAGTPEPTDWMLEGTSTSTGTQAGTVGVSAYLTGSVTNAPITYTFDDFAVTTTRPEQVGNFVPTGQFTAAVTDLRAALDASASTDVDGTIASWAWSFGDGATGTGAKTSHTYATAGTKDVTLTVTDDKGASSTTTSKVVVTEPNKAPTAAIVASTADLKAVLDGTTSTDSDGTVASYAWTFGDGTTGTGAKPTHSYTKAGTYTVGLTVTDNEGATASSTTSVTVKEPNKAPTAAIVASTTDLKAVLDGTTSTDSDGTVASYAWTFGDGTTGTGAKPTHYYAKAGTYTVALTVTDNEGATASSTTSVTAKEPNKAPTARFTSSANGLALSADGSTSTDPDGTLASYAWTFGDGTTGTGANAQHTYAAAGTFNVTLTVTDNEGAKHSTTTAVTVRVPNKAPTAAMTPKVSALSATFDAAASSDPDGSLVGYAWTFGDGAAGEGVSTSHTYATPGTYTVTLIVTDNEGATGRFVGTVVASAPAPAIVTVASDTFTTARTNGWGNAITGGTWTHAGLVGNYSTSGSVGRQVVTTAGSTRSSELHDVSTTDADLRVTVAVDKPQSGSGSSLSVWGRKVGNYSYGARIKLTSDGKATLGAMDNSTALSSASLGTYTPGTKLNVRVNVTGVSPTTVRAKAWAVGTTEPAAWMVTGTSSTAGLQSAGSVGFSAYVASNVTAIPMTASYSDFQVLSASSAAGDGTVVPQPTPVGMPGADNTGVPNGTVINKVVDGNVTITTDGTVIDGWDIRGYVSVRAKNVVIRNSYIRGAAVPEANDLVRVQNDAYSVTIEDSTLVAQTMSPNVDGVKGWNFTLRRVEISNVIDTVHIHGPNVLVEDSWLHDNAHYYNDPNWNGGPSHSDSVQIQGGANITVRHSTITGAKNAAFMVTQGAAPVTNLSIADNYLDGGACTINISAATYGSPAGMSVANNVFGRGMQYAGCAVRIPTDYALDLRGNTYDDGAIVGRSNI